MGKARGNGDPKAAGIKIDLLSDYRRVHESRWGSSRVLAKKMRVTIENYDMGM